MSLIRPKVGFLSRSDSTFFCSSGFLDVQSPVQCLDVSKNGWLLASPDELNVLLSIESDKQFRLAGLKFWESSVGKCPQTW